MQRASAGPLVTIVSLVILAWGASGMVLRLRFAINTMWDLAPVEAPNARKSVLVTLTGRLISMGIILAIGFFLLALLILNTLAVPLYSVHLQNLAPELRKLASPTAPWISFLLYFCVLALTLKLLPQGKIRWRDLWAGALMTTVLFWLGNFMIKIYIAVMFATSIHGVGASTIVFMLWVYYSALIVLFGTRFTYVYAERYGTPIVPSRNMQRI
jgi:membrane protein